MPILSSCGPWLTPGQPASTMNAVILPSGPSVRANTVKKLGDAAVGDPDLLAVQRPAAVVVASSPWCGSTRRRSPRRTRSGRTPRSSRRSRASAGSAPSARRVPNSSMPFMPIELCAPIVSDTEPSWLTGLRQHARIRGVRQLEAAVLLGDDQAEQARVRAAPGRTRRAGAPRGPSRGSRRPCRRGTSSIASTIMPEHLAIALADRRIGKQVLLDDLAEEQVLRDALPQQQSRSHCSRRSPFGGRAHELAPWGLFSKLAAWPAACPSRGRMSC